MAYQSIWYFTDLPEKVVDLIEQDLTETFDPQMADSRLHGDSLNKEKRNKVGTDMVFYASKEGKRFGPHGKIY